MTMKKRLWIFGPIVYVLTALCIIMLGMLFALNRTYFYIALVLFLGAAAFFVFESQNIQKAIARLLAKMSSNLDLAQHESLISFPLPVFVANSSREIVWYNEHFKNTVLGGIEAYGSDVSAVLGDRTIDDVLQEPGAYVEYNEHQYKAYAYNSRSNEASLYIFVFVDETETFSDAVEYHETRPCVMLMLVDNYDELLQNAKESEKAQMIGEIESLLEDFISKTNGFMRKLDRDRFIAVVEERHMREIVEGRFQILDKVRKVTSGERLSATLSIGVGRDAANMHEADELAGQALDMALGRGGDQAAVKTPTGFEFFGGMSKGVEKRTKVKTRIIAAALLELIEASDNVIVMGHRFADLDALGSAIGMASGIRELGKDAVVAINKEKNLAKPLYDRMVANGLEDLFIEPDEAMFYITKKTLLIVVDTHIPTLLESAEIYQACKSVVVIDHHRKMVNHIANAVIFYHEPFASSASEMVTELLQYFSDKPVLNQVEAEALLSGIMLDTKNFVLKTGVRTFEAAAYLKKLGADTVEVRKLFASDMESYQRKTRLVSAAEVYRECAIATSTGHTEDMRVVAPQAADELLGINAVDASFVLFETGDTVNINARSMGEINVQLIMEKLGGGGHLTMAGAQIKGVTMENARQKLLLAIDDYYDEIEKEQSKEN